MVYLQHLELDKEKDGFHLFLFSVIIIVVSMMEQFKRFELMIGEKIEEVIKSKVLVLGLGGVGSYAVEALVRSGIGSIVLVDYDNIDITNLNRQLMTTHDNIGKSKTSALVDRIKSINPSCHINTINKKIDANNIEELYNKNGELVEVANHAQEILTFKIDQELTNMDMIRQKK